jgi:RimJ/RimL family protein N-acetyltransferase
MSLIPSSASRHHDARNGDAPATTPPVLQTERLVLRGHLAADFGAALDMWRDVEFVRHLGRKPLSDEEVWLRLLRYAGNWALVGYGFWLVAERAGGRFVGEIGFQDLRRETEPSFAGVPEIGWGLRPAFHGQGLAREAVAAALAWGDANIATERTICMIRPENAASMRVAGAAGYVRLGAALYEGNAQVLFTRERPLAAPA